MTNITFSNLKRLLLFGIFIFFGSVLTAQVEFKTLEDFGTAISDINSEG